MQAAPFKFRVDYYGHRVRLVHEIPPEERLPKVMSDVYRPRATFNVLIDVETAHPQQLKEAIDAFYKVRHQETQDGYFIGNRQQALIGFLKMILIYEQSVPQ